MIIGVDIDDVISDAVTPIMKFYNKEYSSNITWDDLSALPYLGFLGETREEAAKKLLAYNTLLGPMNQVPYPEAVEALRSLSKKHTLYAITSRPYYIREQTMEWINLYFPGFFKEVIFNNNHDHKKYLPQGESKHEILKEIGANIFIDDLLKYVTNCPKDMKVFLMDKPWNQEVALPENVKRVKNWEEILNSLN